MKKKQKISIPTGLPDQVGALIEDFNSKVDLVLEQTSEIPKIKKNVERLTEDMEIVKSDLESIKYTLRMKVDLDDFQALEHRVALLESRR